MACVHVSLAAFRLVTRSGGPPVDSAPSPTRPQSGIPPRIRNGSKPRPGQPQLECDSRQAGEAIEGAIRNYELAARMLSQVPDVLVDSPEAKSIRELYELDDVDAAIIIPKAFPSSSPVEESGAEQSMERPMSLGFMPWRTTARCTICTPPSCTRAVWTTNV